MCLYDKKFQQSYEIVRTKVFDEQTIDTIGFKWNSLCTIVFNWKVYTNKDILITRINKI